MESIQVNYYETNVTVQLGWTSEMRVSYSVIVEPQAAALLEFIRSTAVQVTMGYNIHYRLSIVSALCDQRSTTTVVDHYLFGKFSISDDHF